jgi:hypothetical protein
VPIPLPTEASSAQVKVQGVPGLLVTLSGGAGIVWETSNVVYILLTTHASSDKIQQIANSMQ